MLPRRYRADKKLFKLKFNKIQRYSSPLFNLEAKDLPPNKLIRQSNVFSVIVSKKTAKTAVLRNLIKRRVYNIINNKIKNIKVNKWLVVFVKKPAVVADYKELEIDLLGLVSQIK